MRTPVLITSLLSICLLFASCKKLGDNAALSSVFLESLSANNQVTPFANEIVQITSLPTFGSGGIFLSYSFPSGQDLFEYFDIESIDEEHSELFNSFISNVISNEKGDLWVLTWESLEHYLSEDEIWVSYPLPMDRVGQPIAISIQRDGSIVCVNELFVMVFENGLFTDLDFNVQNGTGDLRGGATTSNGSIWVNAQNGLMTINANGEQIFYQQIKASSGKDSKVISLSGISFIREDGAGQIWLVTSTELLNFSGESWSFYSIGQHPDLYGTIRAMEIDSEGHVWLLSENNLVQIKLDGSWQSNELNISMAELAEVYSLYIDEDQEVWLQTNSGFLHFQLNY